MAVLVAGNCKCGSPQAKRMNTSALESLASYFSVGLASYFSKHTGTYFATETLKDKPVTFSSTAAIVLMLTIYVVSKFSGNTLTAL